MKIGELKLSKLQLVTLALLIFGLIVAVFLVQRQVIFKSKADERLYNAFEVTDSSGNPICNGNECQTEDLNIKVKINLGGLEEY